LTKFHLFLFIDFEVNLLKLIDLITNGTRTDINETGTSLYFVPGLLIGGSFEFDCKLERSISYYLQVLFCIAPFGKKPLEVTLKGVTNDSDDLSVRFIKKIFFVRIKLKEEFFSD